MPLVEVRWGSASFISACLFASAFVLALWQAVARRQLARTVVHADRVKVVRHHRWFARFLALSFLLRAVWFVDSASGLFGRKCTYLCPHVLVSLANRAATTSFFAAFSFVVVAWASIVHEAAGLPTAMASFDHSDDDEEAGPRGRRRSRTYVYFVTLNVWLALLQAVTLALRFAVRLSDGHRSALADADAYVNAFFFALLAVSVLFHGHRLRRTIAEVEADAVRPIARTARFVVLLCAVLFAVRAALFLLRPLFDLELRGWLWDVTYPWLFYTAPELLPGVSVLLWTAPHSGAGGCCGFGRRKGVLSVPGAADLSPLVGDSDDLVSL